MWIRSTGIAVAILSLPMLGSGCASDGQPENKTSEPELAAQSTPLTITPHINTSPGIADFVLYADRKITFGTLNRVRLGDVGVRAFVAGAEPQLNLGTGNLLPIITVLAPSVSVGALTTVGVVQTRSLLNGGGLWLSEANYPAEKMPAVPPAPTATPSALNVTVGAFQTRTLSPGNYGALNVSGTVLLSPGTFSFASVALGTGASLTAIPGGPVQVRVAGSLSTGPAARISPSFLTGASNLQLAVAGASADFGPNTSVTALVTAPQGSLTLGNGVTATGAFAAREIVVANNVTLLYQGGFSPPQVAGTYCANLRLTAQFPLPPLVPIDGVATLPAPLAFVVPSSLPVANGTLGISAAQLAFSVPNQPTVTCSYAALGLPVTNMQLQFCTGGVTGGSVQRAQTFKLTFASAVNLGLTPVTLDAVLSASASGCDDHDLCTADSCAPSGFCSNREAVVCQASDANHLPGVCQPSTGTCTVTSSTPPLGAAVPPTPLPDPPPPVVGCYEYTRNGWRTVPCADPVYVESLFGRPNVELGLTSNAPAAGGGAAPLVYGQVETILPMVGTVNDVVVSPVPAVCGTGTNLANSFSIQGNTNGWTGSDMHTKAVQFVIQSNGTDNAICIWRIDVTSQTYPHDCVMPRPKQRSGGLRAFDSGNLAGFVNAAANTLTMVAELSWVPNGDATHYALVVPDDIGLEGNWLANSGSILGRGECTQVQFTNTELLTRLAVSSCEGDTSANDPTCAGTDLSPNVTVNNGSGTVETNNLTAVAAPAVSYPNADLAIASYISTTSGACLGPTAVYVKDRADDSSAEPSNTGGQPFWESPDIFVVPSGSPVDVGATASDTLITPGANYDVWVRVNNDLGCAPVTGVKALVYLADPSALSVQWVSITGNQYLGGSSPTGATVATGSRGLVGPFPFTAPNTGAGTAHKCLIAAVTADGEPPEADTTNAPASNQVAQRNVQLTDCQYPLTNATTTNGTVGLTLSVDPITPTPSLGSTPNVQVAFDDPASTWLNVWQAQAGSGTAFTVSHAGTITTVRLGQASVTLNPVPLAAGETRVAKGNLQLGAPSGLTTLSLQAELLNGTNRVVVNGGSCQANPPPVIP